MVTEEVGMNFTEFISSLPPNILTNLSTAITILKAVGVVALVYFIYLLFIAILNFRRRRLLKNIEKKVDSIDHKLDRLLKKKKK